jgi:hypothetical protein
VAYLAAASYISHQVMRISPVQVKSSLHYLVGRYTFTGCTQITTVNIFLKGIVFNFKFKMFEKNAFLVQVLMCQSI